MSFEKKNELLLKLAENFILNDEFYCGRIDSKKLCDAWKIYRKNKHFENQDGYNSILNREIKKAFGTLVANEKNFILWSVVVESFDYWLKI